MVSFWTKLLLLIATYFYLFKCSDCCLLQTNRMSWFVLLVFKTNMECHLEDKEHKSKHRVLYEPPLIPQCFLIFFPSFNSCVRGRTRIPLSLLLTHILWWLPGVPAYFHFVVYMLLSEAWVQALRKTPLCRPHFVIRHAAILHPYLALSGFPCTVSLPWFGSA